MVLTRALETPAHPARPRVVAVDGPSGSGKSTLAEHLRLLGEASGLRSAVVHVDDLLDGWIGLQSALDALERQLLSLLTQQRRLQYRRYDWHRQHFATPATLDPCDLLIFEGVGAGAAQFAQYIDVSVWVDADAHVRKTRALLRDGDDYAPWFDAWAAQEHSHHVRDRTRRRADLTFRT